MTRLFVALWPPDEVREELRQLHRKDQRGVRFVPEDNWHVTLRFLGEADVDEVAAALDTVRFEPAVARLGPAVDVLHERALVVPVGGSDELAAAVAEAMHNIGEPARKRFHGHLTVARVKPTPARCLSRMKPAAVSSVSSRLPSRTTGAPSCSPSSRSRAAIAGTLGRRQTPVR